MVSYDMRHTRRLETCMKSCQIIYIYIYVCVNFDFPLNEAINNLQLLILENAQQTKDQIWRW